MLYPSLYPSPQATKTFLRNWPFQKSNVIILQTFRCDDNLHFQFFGSILVLPMNRDVCADVKHNSDFCSLVRNFPFFLPWPSPLASLFFLVMLPPFENHICNQLGAVALRFWILDFIFYFHFHVFLLTKRSLFWVLFLDTLLSFILLRIICKKKRYVVVKVSR